MNVSVKIPEEIFRLPSQDVARQILETFALEGFKAGKLTTYQVRRILGYETRFEVHEFLARHGVPWVDYPVEDLERERRVLRELLDR